MASGNTTSWPELIARNYQAKQKYYDFIEAGVQQQLGPPASPLEIEDFESMLGWRLPPSYREFLLHQNGWSGWEGDVKMLSLSEMRAGPYADWIRTWKGESWHSGAGILIDGLVIAAELSSVSGLILDTRTQDKQGEMEIVNWERKEIARYDNMVDLFIKDTADWEAVLAEEVALQNEEQNLNSSEDF